MPFRIEKFRAPKIRAPKTPAELNFPKPRKLKSASRAIKKFDLTIFSDNKESNGINSNYLEVLKELVKNDGSQSETARSLNKSASRIGQIARKIYKMCENRPLLMKPYATKLGVSVEYIKIICDGIASQNIRTAKRRLMRAKSPVKHNNDELNSNYIKVLRALFETDGHQTEAGKKLRKFQSVINRTIHKILQMQPDILKLYADELGVSVDDIKNICSGRASLKMRAAKKRLMKAK